MGCSNEEMSSPFVKFAKSNDHEIGNPDDELIHERTLTLPSNARFNVTAVLGGVAIALDRPAAIFSV